MAIAGKDKKLKMFGPKTEEDVQDTEETSMPDETPQPDNVMPPSDRALSTAPMSEPMQEPLSTPASETDVQAYQRLSKQAEQAAPTESDVLAAGLRKGLAFSRAESPEYLARMSETAFYRPDASGISRARLAEAEQPDIGLTAKQQAQKRLQDLAESARKRALLPGQMAEQQAQVSQAQAKLDLLKPASPEEIAAAERDLGIKFAKGATRGDVAKATSLASETAIKGGGVALNKERLAGYQALIDQQVKKNKLTPVTLPAGTTVEDAKKFLDIASKNDTSAWREASLALREQQLDLGTRRFEHKVTKEAQDETVSGVGRADTIKDADIVRQKLYGTRSAKAGIDALKDKYAQLENTPITDIAKNTQLTREIAMETKNLVMSFKEKYGLGAPQTAELKFLYDLVGKPDTTGVIANQIVNKLTGTTMGQKLDSLKSMLDRDFEEVKNVYIKPENRQDQTPAAQPAAAPAGQAPAPSGTRKKTSAADLP